MWVFQPKGGLMEVFRHDQTWPEHSDPNYHGPLRYARKAEWTLLKYDGHSWGRVVCHENLPHGQRCEILILRSANGGEAFALGVKSKIDGCPHGKGRKKTSRADRLNAAETQLDEAETLVQAARRCIDSQTKQAGAQELLALAEDAIGSAESALLDQAAELESDSIVDYELAIEMADAAGFPEDFPVEPDPLLDEASSRTRQVLRATRGVKGRGRSEIDGRVKLIRASIESLRSELGD